MTVSEARRSLGRIVARVSLDGERIVLSKDGKYVAAIVPVADLEMLRRLEDAADRRDASAARAAVARKGAVPWSQVMSKA